MKVQCQILENLSIAKIKIHTIRKSVSAYRLGHVTFCCVSDSGVAISPANGEVRNENLIEILDA